MKYHRKRAESNKNADSRENPRLLEQRNAYPTPASPVNGLTSRIQRPRIFSPSLFCVDGHFYLLQQVKPLKFVGADGA